MASTFARDDVSLGNGYFSTKLDVAVPRKDLQPLYQAVADGVRKAVLLSTGSP